MAEVRRHQRFTLNQLRKRWASAVCFGARHGFIVWEEGSWEIGDGKIPICHLPTSISGAALVGFGFAFGSC
jgi:hypothetical protein